MKQRLKIAVEHMMPGFVVRRLMRRRYNIRFDPKHSVQERFASIFKENLWGDPQSVSGCGSTTDYAKCVSEALPPLCRELGVKTLLDIPCGDFNWMQHVQLGDVNYIGGDIVPALIETNQKTFGSERREFRVINLMDDPLPPAELLLTRHCLIHLSFANIEKVLRNVVRSGIPHLLTTHYPYRRHNWDIADGQFRAINLCRPPFNLVKPTKMLRESEDESPSLLRDVLGLWTRQQLIDSGY